MGRRTSPSRGVLGRDFELASAARRVTPAVLVPAVLTFAGLFLWTASPAPAQAQSVSRALPSKGKPSDEKKDRLLVEAKEIVYDRDKNTVSAVGNVQLYYQGRTLEADKVTYDRNTSRVYAEGNAKLTEADGTVSYADRFDLTDNFRDGFVDSLRSITKDKTRFTAPRAERTGGETTVFEKGTYTACEPCKEHPERPPLWQVRAARIIHKNQEHMIYYEDAYLEFLGVPLLYLPYFSTPDPNVTRKSGFLPPSYVIKNGLGFGVSLPYFFNLAPNYDLTFTPIPLSRQGLFSQLEWRHRLMNGSYDIRASGIFQLEPSLFKAEPFGPGMGRTFRGSIETSGKFYINERWKFGWDIAVLTDKYYIQDYKIRSESLSNDYIRESISTAYLTGQDGRAYFDLRGYRIQGLSKYDFQNQQPLVVPVLDYNKVIAIAPERSAGIGGEFTIDLNLTNLSRDAAAYQAVGTRVLDRAFALYDVCEFGPTRTPAYHPGSCFMRGIGGDYARASVDLSWRRKIIDPIGEVWTPFAFARADGTFLSLNKTSSFTFAANGVSSTINNSDQTNFFGSGNDSSSGRAQPGVGLEWRYPFLASTSWATHVVEPIAQIIARPSGARSGTSPNEDAQSLVFDDTTLFDWDKFSGYDRLETGVRLNAGAQYTANFTSGGYANVLAGQSFQLAGRNPYSVADVSNVGLGSGLDTSASDYVGRVIVAPNSYFSFIAKGRFKENDFDLRALDLIATMNYGKLGAGLQFSRYAPQPQIGFDHTREGILANARYNITDHYFVNGVVVLDLNHYRFDTATQLYDIKAGPALAVLGVGFGYHDECTTFTVNYSSAYSDSSGTRSRNQTLLVQLTLRTLGEAKLAANLGSDVVQDGVTK